VGLPGTNGFVSELLIIFGIYEFNHALGYVSALTVIITSSAIFAAFFVVSYFA
jgi:NADH-quinone oxidoreductase subunit M